MIFIDIKYNHEISPHFDKIHKGRDYLYNLRCPYCGDSEKFKNKARGYFYRVKDQMNYRCHNCDYGTTAGNVVKYINPEIYKEYVKAGSNYITTNTFRTTPRAYKKIGLTDIDAMQTAKKSMQSAIKKIIDQSKISYKEIKNLYFFPSRRWDLELRDNTIIKLPNDNTYLALNLAIEFLNDRKFKDDKIIDARIENQIILND